LSPASQGIKWIKNREEPNGLVIVQQSQPKYIDKVIHCIENGIPLLFENLPIDIDAGACTGCCWTAQRQHQA
jgi:dynein heavy chain